MKRFADLSIRTKFDIVISAMLICYVISAAIFTYYRQQSMMLRFAVDNARIFARGIVETRDYMSAVVRGEAERNYALVPQVVATQVANRLTHSTPYYVRQVSLRYRNPGNKPDAYETEKLKSLQTSEPRESYDLVGSGEGRVFRYIQPMIAGASCLECHGSYQNAPKFVQQRFPRGHYSYNYRQGEVLGAVSVKIPLKDLYAQLGTNFKLDILASGGVFFLIMLILSRIMRLQIIDPIKMVSERITSVTKTGDFSAKLPVPSKDEIGGLIAAFNEMMDEVHHRTLQSKEADERYRRLIAIAGSSVVTFLSNGKIVIANQKSESLFRLSTAQLLGESIFSFLGEPEDLQKVLSEWEDGAEHRSNQVIVRRDGTRTEVETVIAASHTDREPMFTAIFREGQRK